MATAISIVGTETGNSMASCDVHFPVPFDPALSEISSTNLLPVMLSSFKNISAVISVNDVQITVVGTSFNVKSSNGNTEVIVETGIVKVTKAGKTVELKAKEKLLAETKDSALIKDSVNDQLYKYYRTREFVCDNTPLWKLVEVVNEAYQANIVIADPALKDMKLTTTFYNESLEQVLNVIIITFDIKASKEGNTIILQP